MSTKKSKNLSTKNDCYYRNVTHIICSDTFTADYPKINDDGNN